MNFFQEQEKARKRIAVFRLSFHIVVLITTIVTAMFVFNIYGKKRGLPYIPGMNKQDDMSFLVVACGTYLFIMILSWYKRYELGMGGPAVAKLAGGLAVSADEKDPALRKLQNVVEEMSIAAGIVPPKVYLLTNEDHINAFAAGFTSHDAVVAVSKGCLERLNRDELQGVVAHEIGHILTGDMKLNLELIGYLNGLMGISNLGRRMMRGNRSSRKNNSALPGLGLFLIGLVGYFLGLILKFSISRGQEFHADAKSVQLTRNPEGIGGALKKILASEKGFRVNAAGAHEISHLYFFFPKGGLFSTHPPLGERIKRILPTFHHEEFHKKEMPTLAKFMASPEDGLFIKSFASPEIASQDLVTEASELFYSVSSSTNQTQAALEKLVISIDLNIGRLRSTSPETRKHVLTKIREVASDDKKINSRELICYALYKECLEEKKAVQKSRTIRQKIAEAEILLTFLANLGNNSEGAFAAGAEVLFPGKAIIYRNKLGSSEFLNALHSLKELRPYDKEILLKAVDTVIYFDRVKNSEEILFLKVLRQTLDVPAVL